MKKHICVASLLMVVLLVPVLLSAQGERKNLGLQPGVCAEKAKIDPDTKVKLEKLMLEFKLKNVDLVASRKKIKQALKEEMLKEKASRQEVDKLSKKLMAVESTLHENHVDYAFAVREILNPEQFKAYMARHGGEARCGCGSCGGDGGCCAGSEGCRSGGGRGMHKMQGMGRGCGMDAGGCKVIKKVIQQEKKCCQDTEKEIEIIKKEKE
ncbi:MAG: hypothetical protein JXB45_06125 [Candidatus Krumholzibacteriota bacterium]|nr:hypothetical protein [Candidatus Krumholzibacteriota bacterium]